MKIFRILLKLAQRVELKFNTIILVTLLSGVLELIIAFYITQIFTVLIDVDILEHNIGTYSKLLSFYASILLSCAIFKTYFMYQGQKMMGQLAMQASIEWGARIFSFYSRKTERESTKGATDEEIFNIHSVTSAVSQQGLLSFIRMTSEIIIALVLVIYMMTLDMFALFCTLTLLCLVFLLFIKFVFAKAELYGRFSNVYSQQNLGLAKDGLSSRRQVHFCKTEPDIIKEYQKNGAILVDYAKKASALLALPKLSLDLIAIFVIVCIIWLGTFLNLDYVTTLSVLSITLLRILPLCASLMSNYNTIKHSKDAIDRLVGIFERIDATYIAKSSCIDPDKLTEIWVPDTSINYHGNNIIFPSMSFRRGEMTVVKGQSGCGKSVLAEMLAGIAPLDVDMKCSASGKITSFVPSPDFVFYAEQSKSIFSNNIFNFLYVKPDVSHSEKLRVKTILRDLPFMNFLNQDVESYSIADLSGGQQQRVAAIRPIIYQRPVIILDEPASALDQKTANLFYATAKSNFKDCILIIIAHDELVNRYADVIYQLEKHDGEQ